MATNNFKQGVGGGACAACPPRPPYLRRPRLRLLALSAAAIMTFLWESGRSSFAQTAIQQEQSYQERAPVTQSLLDQIMRRGVLRVGTTDDYKPFTFRADPNGAFEGLDIDQAKALAAALGVRAEFVQTRWPDLARDFEAGMFDIAMGGVSITLERAKKGYFSIPYLREGKTPITRCADSQKFDALPDIDKPDMRVIVNPGGTNEAFARSRLKQASIRIFTDNRRIFEEIAEGRADVMITDASETRFQAKLHPGVLCAAHPDKPFDFAEKAYWLQRDFAFKAFIDVWLRQSLESGAFSALAAKWM